MINAITEMVIGAKTAQDGIEATLSKEVRGVGDPIMLEAIDGLRI
nr:hypothetical protein [uncultured Lysinibacillus sp.]